MAKAKKNKKVSKPSKSAKKSAKPAAKKAVKNNSAKSAKKNKKPAKGKPAVKKTKKIAKPIKAKKAAKPVKAKKAEKPVKVKKVIKPAKVVAKQKTVKVVSVKTPNKAEKPSKDKVLKADKKVVKTQVKEIVTPKAAKEKPLKLAPAPKRGRKKKNKNGDEEDEFGMDEPIDPALLEILENETKKVSKKGPKILKTFVNPYTDLPSSFDVEDKKNTKVKKEPKGKFELEYVVRTSPVILFECLSTPSGLSEWFADDVNIREGVFTFFWDGSEQKAKLMGYKDEKFIRFHWLDKPDGTYFEFKIEKDELTGDISLIITDFAEEDSDKETSKLLWDSQVDKLLHVLGAV